MREYRLGKIRLLMLAVFVLSALTAACSAVDAVSTDVPVATGAPAEGMEATLTVFAAASLIDAFDEIAAEFDAANPATSTIINFAGSNQLATQITGGAPADLFASANMAQMDVAVDSGRIDASSPAVFATNRLVVIFPSDNPAGIRDLQDLAAPGVLIILAAAEVPVGQYSLEFLNKASADPAFGDLYRTGVSANVVSYEENVRSVLNKVRLGEADAGIVYASDLAGIDRIDHLEIPDSLNSIAEYPIAALNDTDNPAAAVAFIEYVFSDEGQSILADHGFGPGIER